MPRGEAPAPLAIDEAGLLIVGREQNPEIPSDREPVTVVIPAYNEERGVAAVIEQVGAVLAAAGIPCEILVVDDGSRDGTAAAVEGTAATLIRHPSNRGYGASLKTGIRAARHEIVCITDADGTYPTEQLPKLISEIAGADMVVGARPKGSAHIAFFRRPAKWFLNVLANYLTGVRIPDLNSGMRVMRRDFALEYFDILPDRFSFTTTITLAGLCDNYRVTFVPIEYRLRVGRSKIKPIDAISFLNLILRTMTYFRPLRIILPVAVVLFLIGLTKLVIDFFALRISGTTVLFLLGSLNFVFFGVLADMLVFVRHHRSAPTR